MQNAVMVGEACNLAGMLPLCHRNMFLKRVHIEISIELVWSNALNRPVIISS